MSAHPPIYREMFPKAGFEHDCPYIDLVWSSEIGGYIPRPEKDLVPEWQKTEIRKLIEAERRAS